MNRHHPSSRDRSLFFFASFMALLLVGFTTIATPADLIFADGFESGDTSAWSATMGWQPPPHDTCGSPDLLVEGIEQGPYSTVAANDDYGLTCVAVDGPDTVHQIVLDQSSAVLVTVMPLTLDWQLAASLRENCAAGPDLACVASGFPSRFINRPNLSPDTYEVIVDGDSGRTGQYSIRYFAGALDMSFGYWILESTDAYTPLTGATQITIPTGYPDGDSWYVEIALPFNFDYFGITYSMGMPIRATDDMYLTFGAYPGLPETYQPDCLDDTQPNDAIAPFWVDGWAYVTTATLSYKIEGASPNRRLTIEWHDFDELEDVWILPTRVNHQVVLFENGDIEFRYGPRASGPFQHGCDNQEAGCSATIGIEGGSGASHDADVIDCELENTHDGRVIHFVHPN